MDRDTTGTAEEQSHARWRPDARISRRHHQPSAVVAQVPRAGNETADIAGNVGNLEQQSAKFEGILGSLANDNDLPDDLALQLLLGAFYGMASESFSALLHDAYPMPE